MNDELWNEICVQFQFLCQIITNSNEKLIDWFISHFLAIYVANNSVLLYASFREGTPRVKNLLFYPFPPCTLLALLHHVSFLALLIARWFEPVMVFPRVHGASLAIELPSGYLELLQPTFSYHTSKHLHIDSVLYRNLCLYVASACWRWDINDVLLALISKAKREMPRRSSWHSRQLCPPDDSIV